MTDNEDHDGDPLLALLRDHYTPPEPDAEAILERVRLARAQTAAGRSSFGRGLSRPRIWIAAAIIIVIAAGALSIGSVRTSVATEIVVPVRSWAAERLTSLESLLKPANPEAAAREAAPPRWVSLVPADSLIISVERCQRAGRLEILLHDSEMALLQVLDGGADVSLSAEAGEFHLRNGGESSGSYRVLIPKQVKSLSIRLAGRVVLLPIRAPEPTGWVLYLRTPDDREIGHCHE